jgi:hypothetical protein
MASLADLFNPSFFMFLGIMVLIVALLVVYFESKMREQNHKIASMLSLVSTLAEDINGVKIGFNHLALNSMNGGDVLPPNTPYPEKSLGNTSQNIPMKLIEVSDDESEDESEDESDEEINDSDLEDIEDETSQSDLESYEESDNEDNNVKVIKLNISENVEENEQSELHEFDDDNLDILEDIDEIPEMSNEYAEEVLNLKYEDVNVENSKNDLETENNPSELKTISVNLDENKTDMIDYKKLQLPKLRSIIVEKGLSSSSEAQKLKKPEILKLLGVE